MKHVAVYAFLIAVCLLPVGCGDEKLVTEPEGTPTPAAGPTPTPAPLATFTRVQNEVFTPKCALSGCHLGPASLAQEGLVLASGSAYDNIVMMRSNQNPSIFRVTPFDPTNSYLWRKISPGQPIVGERMPQMGSISDAERQLVTDWILGGALRN
ncbi:MAG TPA: hypothetical protein VKS03_11605 [Thermoanaerobaculia bacterium]|nr:hypothetical protein [Thermoanaerobaculia bacterium]